MLAHKVYTLAGIGTWVDQHRLQGSRHSDLQADTNRKNGEDRSKGQG